MYSKEQLFEQLNSFCIADGSPVIVHSSLKAVGEVEGGAEGLLSVLIDYFTQNNGVLCIPTHTWIKLVLDLRTTDNCLGILSTVAAGHPDGVRSLHPTHSMAVFGEKSRVEKFVSGEKYVDTPTSPRGCYGNIINENGHVLLIGVDQTKNTLLHCVEEMMNVKGRLTDEQIETMIIHNDGNSEKRLLNWFDESKIPDVSLNFGKFEPAFRHFDCIEDGLIGNAVSQFCNARKMKDVMELIYNNAKGEELLSDDSSLATHLYRF